MGKCSRLRHIVGSLSFKNVSASQLFEAAKDDTHEEDRSMFGRVAAGVIIQRSSDGNILLLKRSSETEQGGTWGICGGRVDEDFGHDAMSTVRQEVEEEIGGLPKGKFTGKKYNFKLPMFDGDTYWISGPNGESWGKELPFENGDFFVYTTFLYECTDEKWEPVLNWEHVNYKWVSKEDAFKMKTVALKDRNGSYIYPVQEAIQALL